MGGSFRFQEMRWHPVPDFGRADKALRPARESYIRSMRIGNKVVDSLVLLAPMAGVTDRPFRILCRRFGAGLAASEMITGDRSLWESRKSRLRMDHRGEEEPRVVQIAGADPAMMAEAARANVDGGAQIVDINLGCPAKKVCNRLAGSALLRDEPLVGRLLSAVVEAVDVPVTLKIRTGWDTVHRNGVRVAKIAEDTGIAALAVHGRTRADGFSGSAEYCTMAEIKSRVAIPVIANGDIDSAEKAQCVLTTTGCDAVMIGRGALGRPWIFQEIAHFLRTGEHLPPISAAAVHDIILGHIRALHEFYGADHGVRIARKHIKWYCASQPGSSQFWLSINRIDDGTTQIAVADRFFSGLSEAPEGQLAA